MEKPTDKSNKPGCLSVLWGWLRTGAVESGSLENLPYRLRDDFLSPAEFSFYRVLTNLLAGRYVVQSKVRLADIFFVARPNENKGYFNRIAQRHLDFLVCDAVTMKPLFGIELDDASHQRRDRQERDTFVENVFKVANLPLVRVPVQREYNTRQIADLLAAHIHSQGEAVPTPKSQPKVMQTLTPSADGPPTCPKCGIPMVLRTVAQGEHKDKQFYGCQNFPRCRAVLPLSINPKNEK